MSKKPTKKGAATASKGKNSAAGASGMQPMSPAPAESDPPIVVSGGSVTITSKVFLSVSYDKQAQRYVYYTDAVKVKKIKTKGKKEQEDDADNGKFRIELGD